MEQNPIGAIASISSFNGKRLKVVVVGEGGILLDANCRFGHDRPKNASRPDYLPLPDGRRTQGSIWTDAGVVGTAHPNSKLAVCTIEHLSLAYFFYQLPSGDIVMRRCNIGSEWEWEEECAPVPLGDCGNSPALGTTIVVQPSVLRVGDNSDLTLFYQTSSGHIGIRKMSQSGELQEGVFQGRLSLPLCTPFTALTSGDEFTVSYITLETREIWECSGSLANDWNELEDNESYISAAQRVVLKDSPTPYCVQMASYQTEQPIFYSMISSKFESIVWSSSRARKSYRFEIRGMPGTPIALSGHSPTWSSLSVLFVDVHGAVNIGRLGSGSVDGTKQPECFPIPLDSMRNAFAWVLSKGAGSALGLDISPATEASDLSLDEPDIPVETSECQDDSGPAQPDVPTDPECVDADCQEENECAQPPDFCSAPCPEDDECNGPTDECYGASDDCAPEDECSGGGDSPCGQTEVVDYCPEETKSNCGEDQARCETGEEICDASWCDIKDKAPCNEEGPTCVEDTEKGMSNQVEGESNYGICSTCDGDEGETASAEIPSDDEHETVVGDGRDICPETPDCQLPDETGINTASCDGSALSEGSVTPTLPVDVQLPEAPVSPSNEGSFTPTTPSAPASPTSDIPYLPEVLEPVQEVPAVDTNASFVDMIYDCLRYTFKPSGGRYISLQLPARRLDQISSLHIGAASTCGGFNQAMAFETNFQLSDELFDVAKFVSGPNGKSLSQEYENILYSLIPNPESEVSKSLNIQRSIIHKYLSESDHRYTGAGSSDAAIPNQVANPLRNSDKVTRVVVESDAPHPWDIAARFSSVNDTTQASVTSPTQLNIGTGPMACGATRNRPLSYSKAVCAQDISSPTRPVFGGECLSAVHSSMTGCQHTQIEKDLMAYMDVKTISGLLYDAKSAFRKSGRSSVDVSGLALPIAMKPHDWYEASQTSWSADEFNQDLGVLQSQLNQKLSDLDSLTIQLLPFVCSSTEGCKDLELEIESLVKERDGLQRNLESEYPASMISGAQAHVIGLYGSDNHLTSLLGCDHTASPSENYSSEFDLKSITERLDDLKTIDRKLLCATRSLSLKRAQAAMAKSDGPNMQLRSMLESKILEQQTFIEAHIKSIQLSSERYARNLKTSIAQAHLPHSNDPRWSVINISTEVPNMTWENPEAGFGLWVGYGTNSHPLVETVKIDLSFRVSLVEVDRDAWFKSEIMKHSHQLMKLPGNTRWSEWPCDAQAPEEIVQRILQGNFESKGSLPALPTGYLVAKDVLIKVHTSEQSGHITKQDLVKQAATAQGILCFGFAPYSSAHGNAAALHINEYSDGIVFKLPEAQILGYMMQLTPPDLSADYNADAVESGIERIVGKTQYTERPFDKTGDCLCDQNA